MIGREEEMNPMRHPGMTQSFVTELESSGQISPNSLIANDSQLLFDIYLSPAKLRKLSGHDDLQQVTSLQMCIDTQQTVLGNFGAHLPNLVQLKMNNSLILSVRDLGISLSHLQVLSLVRCGLVDLEGLTSLTSLKELYMGYNNVSELSQVSMLEQLELIDLEGNNVDDLVQVQYLGLCGKLQTLTLEGNPVCICPHAGESQVSEYNYRSAVRKLIPHLKMLDDAPVEEEQSCCSSAMMEDWVLLKESIKEMTFITDNSHDRMEFMAVRGAGWCDLSRPGCAPHPGTYMGGSSPVGRPSTTRLPSSPVSFRPGSADSGADTPDYEASDLTHGVGSVLFCGNPLQAIRARRQKIKLQGPISHSRPCTQLGSYVPEHTYDIEEVGSQGRSDVFAELRAWRKEHNKHLLAIERDQQPQVMRILQDDDDDDDDHHHHHKDSSNEYDEGAHSLSLMSDREDEEETEELEKTDFRDNQSPDSSFQSPSPDMSRLFTLSKHTLSPSPPPSAAAPSTGRKVAELRARRLRISNLGVGMQKLTSETITSDVTASGDMNHMAQCLGALKMQPAPTLILHKPHRPDSSLVIPPHRERCSGSPYNSLHEPNICSVMLERPRPTRPHTARAVLQRLPMLPSKASGHLD